MTSQLNHAPKDYICPICLGVQGIENEDTPMRRDDVVYRDELVTAFINSFFVGTTHGHVIVVPNEHYENIYDLPETYGHRVFAVAQQIALAMKRAYKCDGITIRQNNEPAGDQHAFHFHAHIFPRYIDDGYNEAGVDKKLGEPSERAEYAQRIKEKLRA